MTPQEIFEYKTQWRNNAWSMYIDPDADVFTKDWCRRNVERQDWSFEKYARQDDWHLILFHYRSDYNAFKANYYMNFK